MDAVVRGLAIYFVLLIIIRLSGRRTLAQMTPFDLVIVLVISETTQQAMLGDDFSITNAVLLILTLFTTDIGLSYVKAMVAEGGPRDRRRSDDPGRRWRLRQRRACAAAGWIGRTSWRRPAARKASSR
jgi:hypothetical protein